MHAAGGVAGRQAWTTRNVTATAGRAWELHHVQGKHLNVDAWCCLTLLVVPTGATIVPPSERDNYTTTTTTADMWDDEDNNPYGSFARHDSNTSDTPGLASPAARKASTYCLKQSPASLADMTKCRTAPRRRPRRLRRPHKNRPSMSLSAT